MCGIAGILFSTDATEILRKKIALLNDRQRHRGPDGQSQLIWNTHGLCHQRLALIDAPGGQQPFSDNSGRYHLVFNGEIYNYLELKTRLKDHYAFRTSSDTEVLLAAYIHWGEACLHQLNGMFAFLIWDTWTDTGFAARDPLGVKPFIYLDQTPTFYFASEIKALLSVLDKRPVIDPQALAEFLIAPYCSGGGENALLGNIRILEPGTCMYISREGSRTKRYYRFGDAPDQHRDQPQEKGRQRQNAHPPEQDLIDRIGSSLETSVQLSLRADTPVGIFLSGGLDSSLIAAIAARHATEPVQAYTISFEQHESIDFDPATIVNSDDLPFARDLARQLGLPFHETQARHPSLAESLRLLARINDRIPAWEQEFSQHFLASAASSRLKAVLVGDAADETHYGYFFLLNENVTASPRGLLDRFGAEQRCQVLHPDLRRRLDPIRHLDDSYRALAQDAGYAFGRSNEENILAMSTVIRRRWLERLLHNGDIHTMHFGLEARVPFANRNLIDIAAQVPPAAGFKNQTEKHVLREAAKKWLPAGFANRKKSSLPRDPRLAAGYQRILQELLQQPNPFIDEYLHRQTLEALCEKNVVSDIQRMLLFNVICLIFWAEHYGQ